MTYQSLSRLLGGAALLCMVASVNADQLLVTGANRDGNAVYDLAISPSGTIPVRPVIANAITQINSAADAATHSAFDALVWVPNSYCKSLDLIVADASSGQIVRYAGASTQKNCFDPTNGTPTVNPTAQIIFKWSKLGSGPGQPNGVSADAHGNLFVVSSSGSRDPKPSVWVLPFNMSANLYCSGAAGVYCAPVLIDGKFGGTLTLALAETLVASTSAVTSTRTVLWNAGDLLVLVGDSFDARLLVYSQTTFYNSNGSINLHALPLNQPTSTPIPWVKFLGQLAAPFGMDLWPANATLGTNAGLLFTTIDGRILRFDTLQNKFVTDFADRLGLGLQKIKVGTYANVPYAFVAQVEAHNTGQILVFGAPPSSGANNPLAAVSQSVMNPMGLAVTNSGSQSVPTASSGTTPCAPPNAPCVFAPLGAELVSTVNANPGDKLSGAVLEQNCIVQSDPRVTTTGGWTCNQSPLPIGAGTSYCPSFPSAVIPGSVCGHSGPSGAGFAVIDGTATGVDPNLNNSFVSSVGNIDALLPGTTNLECGNFADTGQIPLMAWGPRSDLATVEGTIPEDSLFGSPLGGQPGYLTEMTSTCDNSTSGTRELSMFAIGLGLSDTSQAYVYTLQNQKFEALQNTVDDAAITPTVQSTLSSDIAAVEAYVVAAQSGNFTSNIDCALNGIAGADSFVRGNLPAFSSNLVTMAPGGGNENPAGDIDGRLANWYTVLNTMLAGNTPYASWPLPPSSVPACAPASAQPSIVSAQIDYASELNPHNSPVFDWCLNWVTSNATSCAITSDQGDDVTNLPSSGGTCFDLPHTGPTGHYTLTCSGAPATTPVSASFPITAPSYPSAGLEITSFNANSDDYGDDDSLSWVVANAVAGTTCAIQDNNRGSTTTVAVDPSSPYVPYGWPLTCTGGSDTFVLSCDTPSASSEDGTVAVSTFQFANAALTVSVACP